MQTIKNYNQKDALSTNNSYGSGLDNQEAERRLRQYGANEIKRQEKSTLLQDFFGQLLHPLALLLWGILFEVLFAALVIYWQPLQNIFETHALGIREIALLALFPIIVWASDALRRTKLSKLP